MEPHLACLHSWELFAFVGNTFIRQDVKFPAVGEKPVAKKVEFMSVFVKEKKETGPRLPGRTDGSARPVASSEGNGAAQEFTAVIVFAMTRTRAPFFQRAVWVSTCVVPLSVRTVTS